MKNSCIGKDKSSKWRDRNEIEKGENRFRDGEDQKENVNKNVITSGRDNQRKKKVYWMAGILLSLILTIFLLCTGRFFCPEYRSTFAFGGMTEKEFQGIVEKRDSVYQLEYESESETETESKLAEAVTEKKSEAETEDVTEAGSGVETEVVPEGESEGETEAITEEEGRIETEVVPEGESEVETETVSEKGSEAETDVVTEGESGVETEATTEEGCVVETEIVLEGESEVETEATTEEGCVVETEVASEEGESEVETETVTENESETENRTEESVENESGTEPEQETARQTETEKQPQKVQRGKEYEIRGEQNAWYRDANDRLWVRAGSNLYVETKSGGYGRGASRMNIREDGTLTFRLQKTDQEGNVTEESALQKEAYYVDGEAPEAAVFLPGIREEGIVYTAQAARSMILIAPDGKSGLKNSDYTVIRCSKDGEVLEEPDSITWYPCRNGEEVLIDQEGTYRVYVRTEDQVGNLAFSESDMICVDRTAPEILIEGVGAETANAGKVNIKISCQDVNYKAGSMKISIQGRNGGKMPSVREKSENREGAVMEYFDFPKQKSYDDVYQMEVFAEDISGNKTKKSFDFSVNRFGSVYDLSKDTREQLGHYYLSEPKDIVLYETNIDYVSGTEIFCRCDGELHKLIRGQDYHVTMQGSRETWKRYEYTIPAGYFKKEGVYELLLSSSDRAKNVSDTGIQGKRLAFALDWTAPTCTVTGLEAGEVYEAKEITACIVPHDNIGMDVIRIYHNSVLLREEVGKNDSPLKIKVEKAEYWQTYQVFLRDLSGNEYWSEEIPVYVGEKKEEAGNYQKVRPSAREEEERRRTAATDNNAEEKNSGTGSSDEKNIDGESAGNTIKEKEELEKEEIGDAENTNQWTKETFPDHRQQGEMRSGNVEERRSGAILLSLGILTFLSTMIACRLSKSGSTR